VLIARLIADPATLETRLDAATKALEAAALKLAHAQMLDFCGDVLQLELVADDVASLRTILLEHFGPCDGLIAHDEIRVPQLFVSDMDSTMIGQECIDELADYANIKPQIAEITERAMQGELDFDRLCGSGSTCWRGWTRVPSSAALPSVSAPIPVHGCWSRR